MKIKMLWFLIFLSLMALGPFLLAQDESPVIVGPPKVSVTVFTNWQLIELTYTIGYLDGYQLRLNDASPENMSFGLEIDPEKGSKLEVKNERKFKQENYVDLVYYLRHIGEKKGDHEIPEQVFKYIKEEAGKQLEGLEIHEVKAPGVMLRYDTVLTKNAHDIMDEIDFGSFKGQEYKWKGLAGAMVMVLGALLFMLFRNPVKTRKITARTKTNGRSTGDNSEEQAQERLLPKEALVVFVASLQVADLTDHKIRIDVANKLRQLLAAYVPEILDSDTPKEIETKVLAIGPSREKEPLSRLAAQLVHIDRVIYGQTSSIDALEEIKILFDLGNQLRLVGSSWRRFVAWLSGLLWRPKQ